MVSLSPAWLQVIPKTGTLFIHYLANIIEEIGFKSLGSALDGIAVEVLLLKDFVDVGAVAMHLLGKPIYGSPLLVENLLDDMSHMKIRHPSCIK